MNPNPPQNPEEAVVFFRRQLEEHPDDPVVLMHFGNALAWNNLGSIYQKLGEFFCDAE